jgi:uncharacterized protein YerC
MLLPTPFIAVILRAKKLTPEQIALALPFLARGKTYRQITTMTGISRCILIRVYKNIQK